MKAKVINSIKGLGLVIAGICSAIIVNINIAYASIATRLDPIFVLAESELLTIGKRLCIIALIICGIKYAWASDPQSSKAAKDWGFKILVGLVIMILASEIIPLFATQIAGTTT